MFVYSHGKRAADQWFNGLNCASHLWSYSSDDSYIECLSSRQTKTSNKQFKWPYHPFIAQFGFVVKHKRFLRLSVQRTLLQINTIVAKVHMILAIYVLLHSASHPNRIISHILK